MALSDRNVVMKARQIEDAVSPTQVYNEPNTLFTGDSVSETTGFAQIKNGQTLTNYANCPQGANPWRSYTLHSTGGKAFKGEGTI